MIRILDTGESPSRHPGKPEGLVRGADHGILLLMALLIGMWGIFGTLDVHNRTEAGFEADTRHVITRLEPGGPAETVGMRVGDRIIRIDGRAVEDTATMVRLPRMEAGERRSFTVIRGDRTIRYRPAYRPLDLRAAALKHLSTIVGFSFLLIPLAACLRHPGPHTRILALMGLGLSLAFFDGPYTVNYESRALAGTVAQFFVLMGLTSMLHFLLLFPQRRPVVGRPWVKKLLYGPMLLIWLLFAWRMLFTPPASSLPVLVSQFVSGLVITIYLLVGLFLLLRNYSRTDRAERKKRALNRMLWATVAAIIPAAVAQLVTLVSPDTPLPGQDCYFVFLALIPMSWSLSAARI